MEGTQPVSASLATRRWQDHVLAGAFVVLWCSGYPAAKIAVQHGTEIPADAGYLAAAPPRQVS